MSSVVITRENDVETAIHEALQPIDVESLTRGKTVAVKPNATWATPDDTTAVTQPDTLRGVLRYLKRHEPRKLIVTAGAGGCETDEVFRLAGLFEVVDQEGVSFFDHNRPPFERVELEYLPGDDVPDALRFVMVNPRVLEYDTLISLSQLKLHCIATVTLSIKNIGMSFPAADHYGHHRTLYHEPECAGSVHSFIAAMAKRFPIDLAITVGHPAMIGTGPIGGYTFETGLVIAGTDPVAADAVGARLLGFNAVAVRHLWEAGRMGLGETELGRVDFPAIGLEEAIGVFTEAAFGGRARS